MTTQRVQLMPGVWLTAMRDTQLKTNEWAIQLLTPLREETAALNALLPLALRRGTAEYPDPAALAAALDKLGGTAECTAEICGDVQCIGFAGRFSAAAEPGAADRALRESAQMMGSLLLRPAMRNGRLRQDAVEDAKAELTRRIEARRGDMALSAGDRLAALLRGDEAACPGPSGAAGQVEKITQPKLFAQYQLLLERSVIEVLYCGAAPLPSVEQALREALMGLPRGAVEEVPYTRCAKGTLREEPRRVRECRADAPARLELGFSTGIDLTDPMYPALLAANALLNAKLSRAQSQLGLWARAGSRLDPMKGFVRVSLEGAAEEKQAETVALQQLDDVKQMAFTDEEFQAARRSAADDLRQVQLDPEKRMQYWRLTCCAEVELPPEDLIALVEDVADGQAAAAAMELELDTVYALGPEEPEQPGNAAGA